MKKSDKPIVVEEEFNKNIDTVWKAITEPEQMRKWFFENIPDFKLVVGFKIEFNVESGERSFLHKWRIMRVAPKRRKTDIDLLKANSRSVTA